MYKAKELKRSLVSLLLPNRCPFCDGFISAGAYWCESCYSQLGFMEKPISAEHLSSIISVCEYGGRARDAVLRMKEGGYIYSIEAFSLLMTEAGSELIEKADFITAVPTTLKRRLQLGYSHAEKIARDIAVRSGKAYKSVLGINGAKQEQKTLRREQRFENAAAVYYIAKPDIVLGKAVLLVDDITTTGATLSAIAQKLLKAGAKEVYGLTFAKTPER